MLYIDFNKNNEEYQSSLNILMNNDDLISIPPRKNSFNISNIKLELSFYEGYSKDEVSIFKDKLWLNLQGWIKKNCPNFPNEIIKFCSLHLATHFSLNYISSYNLIKNIIKSNKYSKYTIICSEEMLTIESDWCCPFISLMATVEALDNENANYYLIETSPGIINKLIGSKSLIYKASILDNFQAVDNHIIFKDKLLSSKYFSYQLSNRFNFLKDSNCISIIPKSTINSATALGSYLQFPQNINLFSIEDDWHDFNLMTNIFSKKLECNFFNSIGNFLFPKILSSEENLNEISSKISEIKTLILEEIVDLEAMPLISLFYKSDFNIFLTQHSSNPIIISLEKSKNKVFLSKIYANNNHSKLIYEKYLPGIEVILNPIIHKNENKPIQFKHKNFITIIENDFFRNFGFPFNINKIYKEIYIFIETLIVKRCEFTILWRQRTHDFNPILELLKHDFPNIIFYFDNQLSLNNIANVSNISIGFGQNSSLAIQLLEYGVINYFGSENYSDQEYVPNINLIHRSIGPETSANMIAKSINNEDSTYCDTLNFQRVVYEI